ncbi:hypothetical protein [Streptomyces benahoarensis]|uniref:Uncharacterized protein n=1 Tax=Streptomyces benahoarensis TaxID=2595054 RepID=A0A553Z4L1_9ACTN|nr:hypothetical protein [Streptomyces benahoarensis]TSB36425.1 hypothetical protein FNZ23_19890 [Streptomyces benahoarensis]
MITQQQAHATADRWLNPEGAPGPRRQGVRSRLGGVGRAAASGDRHRHRRGDQRRPRLRPRNAARRVPTPRRTAADRRPRRGIRAVHTDLRPTLLPGGYPGGLVLRAFPNAQFSCTEGYGMRTKERAEGVAGLVRHVETMHRMARRPPGTRAWSAPSGPSSRPPAAAASPTAPSPPTSAPSPS